MLVLSRKEGEEIVIGGNVVLRVERIGRGRVSLSILAPPTVRVDRGEVADLLRGAFYESLADGTLRAATQGRGDEEDVTAQRPTGRARHDKDPSGSPP